VGASRVYDDWTEPPNAQQLRDKNDPALVRQHAGSPVPSTLFDSISISVGARFSFDDEGDIPCAAAVMEGCEQVVRLRAFNDAMRRKASPVAANIFPVTPPRVSDAHHISKIIARALSWSKRTSVFGSSRRASIA